MSKISDYLSTIGKRGGEKKGKSKSRGDAAYYAELARKAAAARKRNRKARGFTLIELLMVLAIVAIIGVLIFKHIDSKGRTSAVSFGWNGTVERRCIDGLRFVVGQNGAVQQVFDQNGKGVPCLVE